MAQSVEHVLGKDEVTSSSLVSSSKVETRQTLQKPAEQQVFCYKVGFDFSHAKLDFACRARWEEKRFNKISVLSLKEMIQLTKVKITTNFCCQLLSNYFLGYLSFGTLS